MENPVPVAVEIGLYEWLMWNKSAEAKLFDWLTVDELKAFGVNVDEEYQAKIRPDEMFVHLEETLVEFHERNGKILDDIVAEAQGQNILIVGHASTVEMAHQRLTKAPVPSVTEFHDLLAKVTFCSVIGLERDLNKGSHWRVMDGQRYPLTHNGNQPFDVSVLSK